MIRLRCTFLLHVLLCQLPTALPSVEMSQLLHDHQSIAINHILYLMHTGETAKALQVYQEYRNAADTNDFELIEQIGLILLNQGYRSKDTEIQRLALFGAGVSTNEKALYILEEGISNPDPEHQLIALNFLARFHNDHADLAIQRAMASNSLLVRLEAAFKLSTRKDPKAVGQTEALMNKVPEQIWPIFPQVYAECGSPEAKKILRKLMTHKDEAVRIATVLSLAESEHDDFLPHIRRMMSHHGPAQQEACATALGMLKDENSAKNFMLLTRSPNPNVKLAALASLYRLGRHETINEVAAMANQGNLFAINVLGNMPGSEEVLAKLLQSDQLQIKINAAVSLLNLGDKRSMPIICQLLLKDSRDIALKKFSSQGMSLDALKVIPSAQQNFEDDPVGLEVSLHLREDLLVKAIELPEKEFLSLAHAILDSQQSDLIPVLCEVLENHPTPPVIELLKKHQQKVGAPLIRNYCNLTLYRLKEPGPYAQNLLEWIKLQRETDLIRFRPLVPINQRSISDATFELTPEETSGLLVGAFESLVSSRDDIGIDVLISIIQTGNSKNKYALIGLLMRAIQ